LDHRPILDQDQGRPVGDTDVTAHISEYIPAGIKRLSPSDTGQLRMPTTGKRHWFQADWTTVRSWTR
jgi:hypothetical protein